MGCAAGPQRLLMTADAVGGVWTYCLTLAEGLARAGVAVDLAVMGPPPDARQQAEARRVPGLAVYPGPFKLEWMDGAADDVRRAGDWLLELEARLGPDVVHLNGYAHGALPFAARKLVVAHSCVLSWWEAVHRARAPGSWRGYATAVRRGVARADHVVAPSATMLRALRAHHGLRGPASVIPNGLRGPAAIRPKEPFILTAGRVWDRAKNVAALVAVAPQLPWPIQVAGDRALAVATTSDGQAPPSAAGRVDSAGPVRYLGRLDGGAMALAYARAAVYALPARYEPFGLSVLEAAAAGCALVLGDIASLRENWDGAAVFVDPDDRVALVEALRVLASDGRRRTELGEKARARAGASRFSGAGMCDAYMTVYRELFALRNPSNGRDLAVTPQRESCAS